MPIRVRNYFASLQLPENNYYKRCYFELEAWNKHLGAISPRTMKFYKPADPAKDF
jgi:hypothetical protein